MPDITMCENHDCPSAKKCYRHEAKPDPFRQSFAVFEVPKGRVKCDDFLAIWKRVKLTASDAKLLRRGLADIDAGRVHDQDDVRKELGHERK